jgi:FAD/FMN-containing dehydrogenase
MQAPITDPEILEGYLTDASNVRGRAEGLLRPTSTAEVAEIVAHCQRHQIPLTVTAARTSTTAGPVPFGGWLLSMEAMKEVERIDHDTATVQAGALLGAFQDQVEATGRFFPPDPTSRYDCTVGAAIACNASGARSFRYGPTRPWVSWVEVVLPDGTVRRVERGEAVPADWPAPRWEEPAVKTAAGYAPARELIDLFIGMEGTLGVLTRAGVRLTDLPDDVIGLLAFFEDRSSAVDFMRTARAAARTAPRGPLSPRCLEYFDGACLALAAAQGAEVPAGAGAALFCEQEVWGELSADDHVGAWYEALVEAGALADDTILATDSAGRARLHRVRHAIPAGINEVVVRNRMPKLGTDLSVPDDGLDAMMDLYERSPVEHVLFGHLGNNHLHLNMLPRTADELAAAKAWYDELARRAVALGGSVSAEHGIGKVKVHQLRWMLGEETLKGMRDLKRFLDPGWILGRGTLFDP